MSKEMAIVEDYLFNLGKAVELFHDRKKAVEKITTPINKLGDYPYQWEILKVEEMLNVAWKEFKHAVGELETRIDVEHTECKKALAELKKQYDPPVWNTEPKLER